LKAESEREKALSSMKNQIKKRGTLWGPKGTHLRIKGK